MKLIDKSEGYKDESFVKTFGLNLNKSDIEMSESDIIETARRVTGAEEWQSAGPGMTFSNVESNIFGNYIEVIQTIAYDI